MQLNKKLNLLQDIPIDIHTEIVHYLHIRDLLSLVVTAKGFNFIQNIPLIKQYQEVGYDIVSASGKGYVELLRCIFKSGLKVTGYMCKTYLYNMCRNCNKEVTDLILENLGYGLTRAKVVAKIFQIACGKNNIPQCEYLILKHNADPNNYMLSLSPDISISTLEWLLAKRTVPLNISLGEIIGLYLEPEKYKIINFLIQLTQSDLTDFTGDAMQYSDVKWEVNVFYYIQFLELYYPQVIVSVGWYPFFLKALYNEDIIALRLISKRADDKQTWDLHAIITYVVKYNRYLQIVLVIENLGDVTLPILKDVMYARKNAISPRSAIFIMKQLRFSRSEVLEFADLAKDAGNSQVAKMLYQLDLSFND